MLFIRLDPALWRRTLHFFREPDRGGLTKTRRGKKAYGALTNLPFSYIARQVFRQWWSIGWLLLSSTIKSICASFLVPSCWARSVAIPNRPRNETSLCKRENNTYNCISLIPNCFWLFSCLCAVQTFHLHSGSHWTCSWASGEHHWRLHKHPARQ